MFHGVINGFPNWEHDGRMQNLSDECTVSREDIEPREQVRRKRDASGVERVYVVEMDAPMSVG